MRLWSLHPCYLDVKGLVALWREGLLAQKVLLGGTKGYVNHPQLARFKATPDPAGAIAAYLGAVADEADRRGYRFDRRRIAVEAVTETMEVTAGQVAYETAHLLKKLEKRDPEAFARLRQSARVKLHPLFREVDGDVEAWEVLQA